LPVTYLRRMSSKELSKLQVYTDANFTIPDHEIRYSLFSTEGAQRVPQRANTIIYRLAVRIKRSVRQRCTSLHESILQLVRAAGATSDVWT